MKKLLLAVFLLFLFINFSVFFVSFSVAYPSNSLIYRTQAVPMPKPSGATGTPRYSQMPFQLTFYPITSVYDRGYQIRNGEIVCVGDRFDVRQTLKGEFFAAGGSEDSPPIKWTDDAVALADSITLTHGYTFWCTYLPGWCYDFQISCSKNCNVGGNLGYGTVASSAGTYSLSLQCPVQCAAGISVYKTPNKSNYQSFGPYPLGGPTINQVTTVTAVSSSVGPNIIVNQAYIPTESLEENQTIKVDIQNTGDMTALFQSASLNVPSKVLYMPSSLKAGQSSELIIETNSLENLILTLNYKSDNLGCLSSKDFSKTFDLGTLTEKKPTQTTTAMPGCTADGDCRPGFICCETICRDSSTGVCKDINGDGIPDWVPIG